MYASHVKFKIAFAALGLSVLVTTQAVAQSGPVDLSPPKRLEAYPDKAATPTRVQPERAPKSDPTTPSSDMGDTVQSESLGAVNPDIAGVMSDEDGGLGSDMWQGTQHQVLTALMKKVPVTSPSPAMRNLMQRLLLTGAKVPVGAEPGSLIAMRAGQLLAMGDFTGVTELLKAVPGYAENSDLLRIEMDARLLTGDVARACQVTNAYVENQSSEYWQKAFIFCQALEGKGDEAQIGMSLLQELGVEDEVFYTLVEALIAQDEAPLILRLPNPTPLHLALARVAKAALPTTVISSNRPSILRSIAISPNAAPELRLEAAERAEVAGALPVDALRQLYASIEFSNETLADPLNSAAQLGGPMSRALLYRATLSQNVPAAAAEALAQALKVARDGGRYASAARAFLPQISRLDPTPDLVWFAPEAIRAFLIANRFKDAQGWFDLLNAAAQNDADMTAALEALMPIARLSGFAPASGWTLQRLPLWWNAVKDMPGARDKAAVLASVFKALGEYVPDSMWVEWVDGPSHKAMLAPHPALWFLLDGASEQRRLGETVLVSLVMMGEGGPSRASPIVIEKVLKALGRVGLKAEARAIALEAVVAAGL